ncbi:MAG: hypothetical protein HDT44_07990 [Ruminococcaceae bacterium]|nr:hypothetical protein [Oscillospiraceae bacterium]
MKIKQMVSIFLSFFLMVSLMVVPISATGDGSVAVSPMYDSANTTDARLIISGTTATCISTANGIDIVKITAVQTLEKYWGLWIWNTVDGSSITKTVNSKTITLTNTISGLSGGKYRVKTVFTFTDSSGKEEKVTVYSSTKTV